MKTWKKKIITQFSIFKHARKFMQMGSWVCLCSLESNCTWLLSTLSHHMKINKQLKKKIFIFPSFKSCIANKCVFHDKKYVGMLSRSPDVLKSLNIIFHVCQIKLEMIIGGDLHLKKYCSLLAIDSRKKFKCFSLSSTQWGICDDERKGCMCVLFVTMWCWHLFLRISSSTLCLAVSSAFCLFVFLRIPPFLSFHLSKTILFILMWCCFPSLN